MQKKSITYLKQSKKNSIAAKQQKPSKPLKNCKKPKHIADWHFYLQQLAKKMTEFLVENKNHENALREQINVYEPA